MGADGGIVGICLKNPSSQAAMTELVAAVPWELRTWDNYDHSPYREAEELPGWWYSTYGTGQDWDLGDLPEMARDAREYAELNPGATFQDWVEDIYTSSDFCNPRWGWNKMTKFLADRYLASWYGSQTVREPEYPKHHEDFHTLDIATWVATIERNVDLDAYPDYEETWT